MKECLNSREKAQDETVNNMHCSEADKEIIEELAKMREALVSTK